MTDIVKRLRLGMQGDVHGTVEAMKKGADEIERLRKALDVMTEDCHAAFATNERFHNALTDIAGDLCSRSGQIDIAKKALAGEPWE